jgi:RNA polymerase sigma-70 factor (ECF subfamily)
MSMDKPDDPCISIELLTEAQAGDRNALNELLKRYEERLRRVVRVRLDARLRRSLDSSDVVQETFAAALSGIPTMRALDRGAILAWLTRIAENELIDLRRRAGARKRDRSSEVPLDEGAVARKGAPGPADLSATAELMDRVDAAVAELPQDWRDVIVLRTYLGASWQDCARQLGCPSADAARQLHRRATVALARLVDPEGKLPRD